MSGYAKSVVFPSSSTLPELVIAVFGGEHPELAYKIYVLVSLLPCPVADRTGVRVLAASSGVEQRSQSSWHSSTSGPTFRSAT